MSERILFQLEWYSNLSHQRNGKRNGGRTGKERKCFVPVMKPRLRQERSIHSPLVPTFAFMNQHLPLRHAPCPHSARSPGASSSPTARGRRKLPSRAGSFVPSRFRLKFTPKHLIVPPRPATAAEAVPTEAVAIRSAGTGGSSVRSAVEGLDRSVGLRSKKPPKQVVCSSATYEQAKSARWPWTCSAFGWYPSFEPKAQLYIT